jgi:ParB family transcriptional regulator, chromosome partitioning protein
VFREARNTTGESPVPPSKEKGGRMNDQVQMIPIEAIRILNPRHRDRKKFSLIVQSIKNLGLKKPIQVSMRTADEEGGAGYDLVCGQGRIEAFRALGYTEIPAVVVEISKEERLLRSLAENMARRNPAPLEMLKEVERLKKDGLTLQEISQRIDVDTTTISGLLALKRAGEERLLDAALNGRIPIGVAVEIARTEGLEMQRELLKACESKQLTQTALRTIRRVMDRRRLVGKHRGNGPRNADATRTTAESLVNVFRRESQKQRLMVKKARICETKLLFVITALRRLVADDHFMTLLRAEDLASMPKDIWDRISETQKAAA